MHVVVVGGGLMGSAAAYHLADRGMAATVVDAAHAGRATSAGAGILSGATSGGPGPAYWDLALAGDRYHHRLASQGAAAAAGYGRAALAIVALAGDRERWEALRRTLAARGAPVREVEPAALAQACPVVGPVEAVLWHDGAMRVDGRLLGAWLRAQATDRGARFTTGVVEALSVDDRRVTGVVLASGSRLAADAVIVAAGAWSTALVAPLAATVPIAPQRGQIVHLAVPAAERASWPILQGVRGHYLLPWPDGHVVAGATRETGSGYVPALTAAGQAEVLAELLRVAPGLGTSEVREWRVGLRPASADGLPLLGPLSGVDGVHLLSGHGAGGLLVGPVSAELVVEQLRGGTPAINLSPFRPDRSP